MSNSFWHTLFFVPKNYTKLHFRTCAKVQNKIGMYFRTYAKVQNKIGMHFRTCTKVQNKIEMHFRTCAEAQDKIEMHFRTCAEAQDKIEMYFRTCAEVWFINFTSISGYAAWLRCSLHACRRPSGGHIPRHSGRNLCPAC